jgi:hypothetical protein
MPETADTGLIARTETRDLAEAAAPVSVPVDDPFAAPVPHARRRRHRGWYRLVSPVAVILLWQLLSSAGLIPAQKLPPPTTIWHTAVTLVTTNSPAYGTLQGAMGVSLEQHGKCHVMTLTFDWFLPTTGDSRIPGVTRQNMVSMSGN